MNRASNKNGNELKICADGSKKIWHYGEKRWVETEPCGLYGCTNLKAKGSVFCPGCYKEFLEDPDAFK